jgi:hypothetical protein
MLPGPPHTVPMGRAHFLNVFLAINCQATIVSPFGTGMEEFFPTQRTRNLHNTPFSCTLLTVL